MSLLAIFQFTSLAMLGWLAAAAAPILIHLFTRKRFRKVTWAAMEYLLAAMKKNRRRIQLEQWLLLAVRTLLLILLGLALADPILSQSNVLTFGGAVLPTHHIFVLDATYSMDLRRDGLTRFDAARQAVRKAIGESPQGDGYSLVLIADPPRVIIGEPAFARNDLLQELDAIVPPHGLGDFAATLAEVESIAAAARKQHSRLAASNVVFYGDLEQTTWEAAASEAAKSRIKKLTAASTLHLMDLGSDDARNAAVVSAEVREAPVTLDRDFTIQAEIASFGEGPRGEKLVTLVVDGEAVTQQSVELDSGGRAQAAFRHRFSSPGDHTIEMRLPDDPLRVDNQRWISVPVREALRALCIYSRPNETRFVALALEPEESANVRVRVEEAADSALLEKDLSQYDALFLVNVPQLDVEQAQVLRNYVEAGGGLVVFPGDLTQPGEFLPPHAPNERPFLPAEFGALASTGNYRFTPLDYRHELITPFRGFERAGLLTTPIWKYIKLKPAADDEVRTVLAFDNGDPAILESRFGRGRVIVFATAASPDSVDRSVDPVTPWSLLGTWPSFPPLVQESLSLVARGREEGRNRLVGESLSSLLRNATPDTRLTMTPASSEERREHNRQPAPREVRLESDGDAWRWSYGDTFISGVYELKVGPPIEHNELFAVNIDPRESPLERIDPARLPEELAPRTSPAASPTSLATSGATSTYAWFRPLMLTVIALLAVESFLARWFGGGHFGNPAR
jgi:hypothetical protein